jgi:hypothetical protein
MQAATLQPIDPNLFIKRSFVSLTIVMALAMSYQWIFIFLFILGPLGLLAVLAPVVICSLAIAALLSATASRLLTLRFPVWLTVVALLLVINDLKTVQSLGGGVRFLQLSTVWLLVSLLSALALAKPVSNWKNHKASVAFVIVTTLIGLDQYFALVWPMVLPGASYPGSAEMMPWLLKLVFMTGLPKLSHVPASAFLGLTLIVMGYFQRTTVIGNSLQPFQPIAVGSHVLIAIASGFVLCIAIGVIFSVRAANFSSLQPILLATLSGWLYAVPLYFLLGALSARETKAIWIMFMVLALAPLATWAGQRVLVDARADEAKRVNAKRISWEAVPINGRPLMVTWTNPKLEEKASQRGFAAIYAFQSNAQRSWYVRQERGRLADEFEGPDDFVEISLGVHNKGTRFAGEGWHSRQPTTIHVYDVRLGKRSLIGTRVVENYSFPAFPPLLNFDGSWNLDHSKTRQPREEAMIESIIDEIPNR